MSAPFNYRSARTKRPCPLWIDAFLRDTMHLGADEVGSYFLLLMAMWMREDCDLPDDDRRLAKVCRVSLRLWQSRIGPTIRPFFAAAGGVLTSKRLRQEAEYIERQLLSQSNRKTGADTEWEAYALHEGTHNAAENSDQNATKPLGNNNSGATADATADDPANHPSYNPTTQPIGSGGGSACEPDLLERVLSAAKVDVSKDVTGKWLGSEPRWTISRWLADLSLTPAEIIAEVESVMGHRRAPPSTLAYFDPAMRRAAGRRSVTPLTPTIPEREPIHDRPSRQTRSDAQLDSFLRGATG